MAEDHAEHDRDAADEQADATTSSLRREAPSGGRPRGRFWYRVVGGVTLVTFAALALTGTLVWLLPTLPIRAENASATVRPPTPVTIDASAAGIVRVNGDGAAWSPESTSFVLASCSGTAAE